MLGKQKAKVGDFNTKSRDGIKSELKYLQKSGEILENRKSRYFISQSDANLNPNLSWSIPNKWNNLTNIIHKIYSIH